MRRFRAARRVSWALAAGLAVRLFRRAAHRPPRIWHGPSPLHSTHYNVAADRRGGYPSRSVVINARTTSYDLVTGRDFDVVVSALGIPESERHWYALADLLRHGDIWAAYFDSLFFPVLQRRKNALALRLVRLAGIRTVVTTHGSDIVQLTGQPTRYGWVERFARDYPQWDFAEQTSLSRARAALFLRHADFFIAPDSVNVPFMPRVDARFKFFPIDTDALALAPAPEHEVPVVIHAPNHRIVKGTEFLLAALERVRTAGIPFELRLIERVPRNEALRMYRDADVIADQFCIGAYGVFALEGLALGKPVLTYLDEEHLRDPAFNLPIVNAVPERLAEILAVLLSIPELRRRIGEASRAAVVRYQSIDALAEVWDRIYRHVWRGTPLELERTAHFDPARGTRALTEDPAQAEFWPVPVGDLMPQIGEALRRIRSA
jgi:glycosyltransferase involved in cell wall biosynthesis